MGGKGQRTTKKLRHRLPAAVLRQSPSSCSTFSTPDFPSISILPCYIYNNLHFPLVLLTIQGTDTDVASSFVYLPPPSLLSASERDTMKQARRKSTRNRLNADGDDFSDGSSKKAKGHSRVGKGGIPQVNPFVEMLKAATVEQAVPLRKIVVLDDTNTLSEAIKVRPKLGALPPAASSLGGQSIAPLE